MPVNSLTAGNSPAASEAAAVTARPIGCSLAASTAPAWRSSSARSTPGSATTAVTCITPVVTVPVLSSTTVSSRRVDSSTSGPLMMTPSWAPRPVPTSSAVGVARPSAHGQAMMSTATAALNEREASPVTTSHAANVASASTMTIGTNTADTRSARRWMGALPFWACSTRRII